MDYYNKYLKYKNKYINLYGGHQKLIDGHQGVDILLINRHEGKNHIVVFEQKRSNGSLYVQLPGGRCEDTHDNLEHVIHNELYEESKKSVCISLEKFQDMTRLGKFVTYPGDANGLPGIRRCYISRILHISKTIFDQNKEILHKLVEADSKLNVRLKPYMETTNMFRIPIENIAAAIIPGDDLRSRIVKDDQGVDRFVNSYIFKAYQAAVASKQNLITEPYVLDNPIEEDNNNQYTDRRSRRTLQGRIVIYR
jgi:hypothetical protein